MEDFTLMFSEFSDEDSENYRMTFRDEHVPSLQELRCSPIIFKSTSSYEEVEDDLATAPDDCPSLHQSTSGLHDEDIYQRDTSPLITFSSSNFSPFVTFDDGDNINSFDSPSSSSLSSSSTITSLCLNQQGQIREQKYLPHLQDMEASAMVCTRSPLYKNLKDDENKAVVTPSTCSEPRNNPVSVCVEDDLPLIALCSSNSSQLTTLNNEDDSKCHDVTLSTLSSSSSTLASWYHEKQAEMKVHQDRHAPSLRDIDPSAVRFIENFTDTDHPINDNVAVPFDEYLALRPVSLSSFNNTTLYPDVTLSLNGIFPKNQKICFDKNNDKNETFLPSDGSFSSSTTLSKKSPKREQTKRKLWSSKCPRHKPPTVKQYFNITKNDVLFGRGPNVYSHAGNLTFHNEKLKFKDLYNATNKHKKKDISMRLINLIHNRGGRFLQKEKEGDNKGRWFEVTDEQAREKAAQILRENFTSEERRNKRRRYRHREA